MSNLHAPSQQSDSSRRALPTRTHFHDFQIAVTAPALIPRPVIAALHGVAFGFPLDALCAVYLCWAASDARISIEELDVGLLAADKGTLARVPKQVWNTSLLHEFAQPAHTFGADEAWRLPSWSCVARRCLEGYVCTDQTRISRGSSSPF